MINNKSVLLPLNAMARRARVPTTWLRDEANAGKIAHLKAGSRILFDPQTVEQTLLERARQSAKEIVHA
jgi:hypothetical protein